MDEQTSRYRNVFITTALLKHDVLFLEAGHGKYRRGVVSKMGDGEVIRSKQVTIISRAEYYFMWAREDNTSKTNYLLVSEIGNVNTKRLIAGR